ncbi:MAG: type II toxin-antitoxin system YoeB family toxin [Magnetococcales bacterium]|nr:type II toxin-antitoxin system YoeB family toxin [Magnetococcales bacterium]
MDLYGLWSRQVTQVHRLVYAVDNDIFAVISSRYHY